MLDDIEAREALHVLLLKRLVEQVGLEGFALKGGVNLRLFFGSLRYSEDMDLDLESEAKLKVTGQLSRALKDPWLETRLRALGLQGVDYSGRPHKNTDTTVRFKLHVVTGAGIRLPTKVELSLRGPAQTDVATKEPADARVVGRYLPSHEGSLVVAHYPLLAAVRQKIAALALRTVPEARDVFDIHVLARGGEATIDPSLLARGLTQSVLEAALRRVWELQFPEFRDHVLEYLPQDVREAMHTEADWDTRRLFVVDLVERVRRHATG